MDSIKMEKLIAMNKYRKIQILQNLFQYCLTAFVVSLCFSKSALFPALCSFLNTFFSVTAPNMGAYVLDPKCLFVVCNVIVIVLVGESKLAGPRGASPASDIYDEYVRRNKSIRRLSSMEEKERREMKVDVPSKEGIVETGNEVGEEEEDGGGEETQTPIPEEEKEEEVAEEEGDEVAEEEEEDEVAEEKKKENAELEGEGDQEDGELLPADELNKRVEDFIARIKNQRKLEARLLLCRG
ncbi:uncharacterized protein [Aristolochia californica]|uniref:uncharacterized protein n=1 Tax=Aristolochia californica TaxID=171875 RepID=UPI0035D6E00E